MVLSKIPKGPNNNIKAISSKYLRLRPLILIFFYTFLEHPNYLYKYLKLQDFLSDLRIYINFKLGIQEFSGI